MVPACAGFPVPMPGPLGRQQAMEPQHAVAAHPMALLSQARPHLAVALAMERRGREPSPNRSHERLVGRWRLRPPLGARRSLGRCSARGRVIHRRAGHAIDPAHRRERGATSGGWTALGAHRPCPRTSFVRAGSRPAPTASSPRRAGPADALCRRIPSAPTDVRDPEPLATDRYCAACHRSSDGRW